MNQLPQWLNKNCTDGIKVIDEEEDDSEDESSDGTSTFILSSPMNDSLFEIARRR